MPPIMISIINVGLGFFHRQLTFVFGDLCLGLRDSIVVIAWIDSHQQIVAGKKTAGDKIRMKLDDFARYFRGQIDFIARRDDALGMNIEP